MKKLTFALLILFVISGSNIFAQKTAASQKYGRTLNLGLGVGGYYGYYGYVGRSLPVFHINYEFDVARNFTLAPFVSFSTYRHAYYWHDNNYYYHSTLIPLGIKGTYYLDQLLRADSHWDFYLAGSLGFVIVRSSWDDGYGGDTNYYSDGNPLFLDLHIGTEYHFNNHLGAFLDFSTGVSTIGLAFR